MITTINSYVSPLSLLSSLLICSHSLFLSSLAADYPPSLPAKLSLNDNANTNTNTNTNNNTNNTNTKRRAEEMMSFDDDDDVLLQPGTAIFSPLLSSPRSSSHLHYLISSSSQWSPLHSTLSSSPLLCSPRLRPLRQVYASLSLSWTASSLVRV